MGFRSIMITGALPSVKIPKWFKKKYNWFNYGKRYGDKKLLDVFPISLKGESKFYNNFSEDERLLDIQRIIKKNNIDSLSLVLLHECGGITLVTISQDKIIGKEPTSWKDVEGVEHNYCYGCSD